MAMAGGNYGRIYAAAVVADLDQQRLATATANADSDLVSRRMLGGIKHRFAHNLQNVNVTWRRQAQLLRLVIKADHWLQLAGHFASLSLLGVGGAITTTPEMQRFLVLQQHWLSQEQFSSSIALAQAAPGPNILFIALMGWNVGLNAAGGMGAGATAWWLALLGMTLAMLGSLLPSCTLNYLATRWAQRNQHLLAWNDQVPGLAGVAPEVLRVGVPLAELAPDLTVPGQGALMALLAALPQQPIERIAEGGAHVRQ